MISKGVASAVKGGTEDGGNTPGEDVKAVGDDCNCVGETGEITALEYDPI